MNSQCRVRCFKQRKIIALALERLSPVLGGVKWSADGDVSVGRYYDNEPRGAGLSDGRQRPDERLDVRPHIARCGRHPVGLVVDRLGRLVEQTSHQVGRVGNSEHLQQEPRSPSDRPITSQNNNTQHVARDAEYAQQRDDVDVDDEFEEAQLR